MTDNLKINERDCDKCQNKTENGCKVWECEFKTKEKPHWKQISPAKIYECSVCGTNVMTDNIECYKYCHGCGAKMIIEKWWAFTFGCGQKHSNHYVKIFGTYSNAREEMFKRYGEEWCWQYDYDEFIKEEHTETELVE